MFCFGQDSVGGRRERVEEEEVGRQKLRHVSRFLCLREKLS